MNLLHTHLSVLCLLFISGTLGCQEPLSEPLSPVRSTRAILSSCPQLTRKQEDSYSAALHPGGDRDGNVQIASDDKLEIWTWASDSIQSPFQNRTCMVDMSGKGDRWERVQIDVNEKDSRVKEIEEDERIRLLFSVRIPSGTRCGEGQDQETCMMRCNTVLPESLVSFDTCVGLSQSPSQAIEIDQLVFGQPSPARVRDQRVENIDPISNHDRSQARSVYPVRRHLKRRLSNEDVQTTIQHHRRDTNSIDEESNSNQDMAPEIVYEEARIPSNIEQHVDPSSYSPVRPGYDAASK